MAITIHETKIRKFAFTVSAYMENGFSLDAAILAARGELSDQLDSAQFHEAENRVRGGYQFE